MNTDGIFYLSGEWRHKDGRIADIGYRSQNDSTVILVTDSEDQYLIEVPSYAEARQRLVNDGFEFRMF